MDRIVFLAADIPSSHKDAQWVRRGGREEVIERYIDTFDQWRESFVAMQSQVDVLILGNNSGVAGWDGDSARIFVQSHTQIPTGCVMDWMAEYAVIGYSKGKLILNQKLAKTLDLKFPPSFVKKASLIIE